MESRKGGELKLRCVRTLSPEAQVSKWVRAHINYRKKYRIEQACPHLRSRAPCEPETDRTGADDSNRGGHLTMNRRTVVVLAVVAVSVLVAVAAVLVVARSNGEWKDECKKERIAIMGEEMGAERPTDEYMRDVRNKYRPLFRGFPHYSGTSVGDYKKPDDRFQLDPRGGYGITLWVYELTDQSTLPEEMRVPDCLEGVPVRIIKETGDPRLLGGA